jgi:hypothetical protein
VGPRLESRTIAIAGGLAAGAVAIAFVAAACIPDLPSAAPTDAAAPDGRPAPASRCGDGIVDLSRGEQCDPGPFGDAAVSNGCTAACRVQCDGGFVWDRNDHCYTVSRAPAGMLLAANAACGAAAHVVTFASEEELEAVVEGLDAGAFWVGIFQGVAKYVSIVGLEPGWQPGCEGCFAHTSNPNAPLPVLDAAPGQACVEGFADLDASWREIPCSGGLSPRERPAVVCEREPAGRLWRTCEAGDCFDLRFTWPGKTYVLLRDSAGPDYAQSECAALGGALVVLESRDEREQLWKELAKIPGLLGTGAYGLLIGLSADDAGAWTWADDAGADAYPPPWAVRQPREGGTQAYLYENAGTAAGVDDTLAHSADGPTWPYVCQLPPPDE